MPTQYEDIEVICPYYKGSEGIKIRCEGIMNGSALHLIFETKKQQNMHRCVYCNDKCACCKVYQMLESKYPK